MCVFLIWDYVKKIDDINETSIYGVMPYVAPEVLKGNPYTQAADIYSFGMIMYVIATGNQPFANCAHDEINKEIEKQFNETQEYRKENFLSIKNNQLTTHTQAIYTSQLLNPYTKNLPKYEDNFNSNTVEITDFTNL
ncbi:unnamed protein product [Rhizophagus irregularis]|nr:unnamed protein product [Rhizophagus irregularis]